VLRGILLGEVKGLFEAEVQSIELKMGKNMPSAK
jgi:hypothetical protein